MVGPRSTGVAAAATPALELPLDVREFVAHLAKSQRASHRLVQRARIVDLAADGVSTYAIARQLGCCETTVRKWRVRMAESPRAPSRTTPRGAAARRRSRSRCVSRWCGWAATCLPSASGCDASARSGRSAPCEMPWPLRPASASARRRSMRFSGAAGSRRTESSDGCTAPTRSSPLRRRAPPSCTSRRRQAPTSSASTRGPASRPLDGFTGITRTRVATCVASSSTGTSVGVITSPWPRGTKAASCRTARCAQCSQRGSSGSRGSRCRARRGAGRSAAAAARSRRHAGPGAAGEVAAAPPLPSVVRHSPGRLRRPHARTRSALMTRSGSLGPVGWLVSELHFADCASMTQRSSRGMCWYDACCPQPTTPTVWSPSFL